MSISTSEQGNNNQQPSYIIASPTAAINSANETLTLCDIKLICVPRRKRGKRHVYLTFVESCDLSSSSDEQPSIEIIGKKKTSSIPLNECISLEYFDTIKNDFQSFIYMYFENYTVSIYFSDEFATKKTVIMKHLDCMNKKKTEKPTEINKQQSSHELSCLATTEQIAHTFDIKLIPRGTIIDREHVLIGRARIYFTTTDLYIASIDCNQADLKTTITNQCPSKDKAVLCIPYFTIKHYGNRSNIFLIELGKSNYGNGEIHMKCLSSSLASTIHLLVSPVIEERPLILSSAFQNQLLTNKRIEKSKNIHPPIQLNHDAAYQTIIDPSLSFSKRHSIECITENSTTSTKTKSRSVFGWFHKLVKNKTNLQRSHTFNTNQSHLSSQSKILSSSTNKFFEFNIEEKQMPNAQCQNALSKSQTLTNSSKIFNDKTNRNPLLLPQPKLETTIGTYIDMGPTVYKTNQNQPEEIHEEEIIKETAATVDMGVNTTISLPPHVRSVIIVGSSVHLIAEERAIFPIGQRSFTSPASVMQPFKAQLNGQTNITGTNMESCITNNSSSIHQPTSTSNSQQSLFLSYGIITLNKFPLSSDKIERPSSPLSDGSNIDHRLNSDLSLMSVSHQRQASNIYYNDKILSSSNSRLFRTLSLSTNNIGDNTSGQICTSHSSIIFFDENLNDQTTNYLLGSPPVPSIEDKIQANLSRVSSINLQGSISRSHLSNINEEKLPSHDSYAFIEPSILNNSPLPNILTIRTKPTLSPEKSINYTDVLLPSSLLLFANNDDEQQQQQESNIVDQHSDQYNNLLDERVERSSTIIYTDINFQQTERRDRIAQLAAISENKDKTPPFVL
ncbi:unnamed protein product [Rotaria magnacalcarata]|uniref:Uncharacterized protein n=4 Tax=Rotaria magnacalcarata TaxID=392030 RepID=A0A816NAQ6_9BILA|nr:unnamed protein product [Rotaria magnacalcarata]CAF4050734.1 unnamed protein product [Rotaria magnacalcarata]